MTRPLVFALALCLLPALSPVPPPVLIRRPTTSSCGAATIYDGSGGKPYVGDVAVNGDRIAAVGLARGRQGQDGDRRQGARRLPRLHQHAELGHRVAAGGRPRAERHPPGGHAGGHGRGGLHGAAQRRHEEGDASSSRADIKYPITWTTLGEYLDHARGARASPPTWPPSSAPTTVRVHEVGYANRPPTAEELARMRKLVDQAMEEGALGVGSSLIYAPGLLRRARTS